MIRLNVIPTSHIYMAAIRDGMNSLLCENGFCKAAEGSDLVGCKMKAYKSYKWATEKDKQTIVN